ncbi:MAG TPA: TIGR03118 family protein [Chthonomonadaceae bacterium]|nr:TIGR03118 family protein [Chthonomonadaceae bacterium]
MNRHSHLLLLGSASLLMLAPAISRAQDYIQTNLVSDQSGVAIHTDTTMVNPWGISSSASSPFWVSDNGTGIATLYNTLGVRNNNLFPTIPVPTNGPTGATAAPTGQVFNGTSDFQIAANTPSHFIFATEDGTISAWNSGNAAVLKVDNSGDSGGAVNPNGAVYKGLAIGSATVNNVTGNYLYAANFRSGNIDVFDKNYAAATLKGNFTDPNMPSGYAPFNIQNINGNLYVTYAKQDSLKHDDVAGAGNGFIDQFNTDGTFVQRIASGTDVGGTLTQLNSPWGLAKAPANFGIFSNDLLVGNFGSGNIDAFSFGGSYLGQLDDTNGNPLAIDGLWGLIPGNGGNGGYANQIYFSAGPDGETHGLFGTLENTPEPGAYATYLIGGLCTVGFVLRHRRKKS